MSIPFKRCSYSLIAFCVINSSRFSSHSKLMRSSLLSRLASFFHRFHSPASALACLPFCPKEAVAEYWILGYCDCLGLGRGGCRSNPHRKIHKPITLCVFSTRVDPSAILLRRLHIALCSSLWIVVSLASRWSTHSDKTGVSNPSFMSCSALGKRRAFLG